MDPMTVTGVAGGVITGLGVLSKPITTLIEKISEATGVMYEPTRIVRRARAEAEAEKIKALAGIDVSDIQQRGLIRMHERESRKQRNIDAVTEKSFEDIDPAADPSKMDNDWIANFFAKCELVSDSEMQSVWARILAGEANRAGSFSKKTLELMSTLERIDADLFTRLCGYNWLLSATKPRNPLILDYDVALYQDSGVRYDSLRHLEAMGLISFNSTGLTLRGNQSGRAVGYFDEVYTYTFDSGAESGDLPAGCALLTKPGAELAQICGAQKVSGFPEFVISFYKRRGVTLTPHPELRIAADGSVTVRQDL
jgi:hypothetical protein